MSEPAAEGRFRLPRNVIAATLTSLLTDISSEMVFNLLPLYLANALGAPPSVIGLIEGIAESTASLVKVFSGWLSDRLRARKWIAVGGYALSTLMKPLLLIAGSWPAVLAIRFADRVGKGIRNPPRDALVAASVPPEKSGLAFGIHRAGDTLGAMLGILLGLGIVWIVQGSLSTALRADTFHIVLWVSIPPAILAVLFLVFLAREVRPQGPPRSLPVLSLKGFDVRFRRFLLTVILFTLGNSADAFLILRAQERGLSVAGVLAMLASFNAVYALVSGPAGALSDRIGRRRVISFGWGIYTLLYLGFALARPAWLIWLLYAGYGLYYGSFEGAARAYIADLVPDSQRGRAYGLFSAAVGLAALPASLIAGILWSGLGAWQGFGPAAPFAFGAGMAGCALLLFLGWVQER